MRSSMVLFVLLSGFLPLVNIQAKTITNLRQFRVDAVAGMFQVDRGAVEEVVRKRKIAGSFNNGLGIEELSPGTTDDVRGSTINLMVNLGTINDYTLQEQLPDELKGTVATNYYHCLLAVPFTSADQQHMLLLAQFTNESRQVFYPYSTNYQAVQQIDSMEGYANGTVVVRNGTDVMKFRIEHGEECKKSNDRELLDHFDDVTGEDFTATDYPLPFDWGCDVFQSQVTFCETLKAHQCEIDRFNPDVCTTASVTTQSKRCPASMQILEVTGVFHDMFPYLVPFSRSFMGEWVDRVRGEGIVFPCFGDSE